MVKNEYFLSAIINEYKKDLILKRYRNFIIKKYANKDGKILKEIRNSINSIEYPRSLILRRIQGEFELSYNPITSYDNFIRSFFDEKLYYSERMDKFCLVYLNEFHFTKLDVEYIEVIELEGLVDYILSISIKYFLIRYFLTKIIMRSLKKN